MKYLIEEHIGGTLGLGAHAVELDLDPGEHELDEDVASALGGLAKPVEKARKPKTEGDHDAAAF